MTPGRVLPALVVTVLAAGFVVLNRGETVVVNLGLARFYQAPLTMVAFVSFLLGMVAMLAMSLRHDLRVRQALQESGMLEHRHASSVPPPRAARPAEPPHPEAATEADTVSR